MQKMFGTSRSFKSTKCKTHLKLVVSRIKLLRNKREIQVKHLKRDVAQLLQNKQDANARTRVDYALREQNMVDAYGIIETYCEFLATRLPSISTQKLCPPDLQEAIASLIYAGPRCADLPELLEIRSIFSSKYGKEFVAKILELRAGCGVSQRIIEKLSSQPLSLVTKMKFMTEVAKEFNVKWEPVDLAADEVKQTPVRQPEARLKGPSHFTSAIHLDNKKGPDNESPKSPLEKTPTPSVHSVGAGYDANSEPEDFEEELPSPAPVAAKPSMPAPVVTKPSVPAPVVAKPSEQSISQGGKQFIPFVMPYSAKESSFHSNHSSKQPQVDPYLQYTRTSMNPYAAAVQEADNSSPAGQVDPYLEHKKSLAGAYTDVAAAAQVAAESADHAAAAARVAAHLAQERLSRESSSSSMSKDLPVRARNLGKTLETKVSVVSLEERVSSYLNSHANDEDSSEWESPLPREPTSQEINPSRNLWSEFRKSPVHERQAQDDDQEQFKNRTDRHHSTGNVVAKDKKTDLTSNMASKEDNKIDKRYSTGTMWTKDNRTASTSNMAIKEDNKLDKRYSTGSMTKDNRTDSTSNMAYKEDKIDKRYSTGNMAAKGTTATFEEDNNLFRSEELETNEPADLKTFGKPVFDDGGTESSDIFQDDLLSGKWHTERRHVVQEEGYDHQDRRGKSLFGENPRYSIERREEALDDLDGNGKPVFDEHPGFSRQDSITVNLQTMHESILSRTEALFEKEDYDSDETTRPRRNRGDVRVSTSSKQDAGWKAGDQSYDKLEKEQQGISSQEWSGWRLSHATRQDHSPPKLHLNSSERQGSSHLDMQKQFHGAAVDDSENPSLGGGGAAAAAAASVRKHRVGASVRTKRT